MLILASASPRRRELLAQAGFTFEVHPAHIPEDPLPNEDPIVYVIRLAREKAEAVYRELTQPAALLPKASETCQGTTSVVPQTPQNEGRALAPEGNVSDHPNILGAPGPSPLGTGEGKSLDPQSLTVLGADTTVVLDGLSLANSAEEVSASIPRASAPPQVVLGKPENPADAARMLRLLSGRTHRVITGVAVVTAQRTEVAAEVTAVKFLTLSDAEIEAYIATGEPMDKAGAYAIQGRAARWIPRIEGDYFNVVGLPLALVSTLLESCNL